MPPITTDVPASTYRLQINRELTFDDAAALCPYLAELGVSHAYLSPILQATPGSAHGYDVIDHAALSDDAGGRPAFDRLVAAAHEHGLKLVADVVPNHMAVPVPESLNAPLWSVLREGQESPYASWFDIDWTRGPVLMPVLGDPVGAVVGRGELTVDRTGEPVLRYFDHVFPLRAGTSELPLPELLAAQHYRLAWWRIGGQDLNYRRFFDVTSLMAIRVEDPEVFDQTHALIADLIRSGALNGLRIDHPDGLADPRGYLRRLATATDNTWVVAEKILEGSEELPEDWPCAGTTGYDALNAVAGLFVDPAGRAPLTQLVMPTVKLPIASSGLQAFTEAEVGERIDLELSAQIARAKDEIVQQVLIAELDRLTVLLERICAGDLALRDNSERFLQEALERILIEVPHYRAYAVPGEPMPKDQQEIIAAAASRVTAKAGEQLRAAANAIVALATDTMSGDPVRDEFVVRFQQTCGPVMAKGIEDTLFYRWVPLTALNEVGADPHRFGLSPSDFHAYCQNRLVHWPDTMTTLSTHDTKRSEDTRARLYALSEVPDTWARATTDWTAAASVFSSTLVTDQTLHLLWQTLLAVWEGERGPDPDRIVDYLRKALREGKQVTTWTAPNEEYEARVETLVRGVLGDDATLAPAIAALVTWLAPAERSNVLGQKLIQLTMPGIPDVYQGCELADRSLVDPDNRRPVDWVRRAALLPKAGSVDEVVTVPASDRLDALKLRITTTALHLRRDHPDWFGRGSSYLPLESTTDHIVAFARGTADRPEAITLATRLAMRLASSGGWAAHTVTLPDGDWTDLLTGTPVSGGPQPLAELLGALEVALLVRA